MTRIIDKDYEHGPTSNYRRTDIICYALLVGLLIFSGVSYKNLSNRSNLDEFLTPVDFFGNQCGKGTAKDYPYLMLRTKGFKLGGNESINPIKNSVCVNSCDKNVQCFANPNYTEEYCKESLKTEESNSKYSLYLGKFCIMDGGSTQDQEAGTSNLDTPQLKNDEFYNGLHKHPKNHEHTHFESRFRAIPALQNFINNPINSVAIFKTLVATLLISQILVLIFSKFTGLLSYGVIIGYFYTAGYMAYKVKQTINGYEARDLESMNEHDREGFTRSLQYLYYGYYLILGAIAFSFMILACFWKKIRLAIKCVKAAGKYTFANLATLLTSLTICALYIVVIFFTGKYVAMKIQADCEQYFDNSLPYMSYDL
jgi:hypothetical protein